MGDTTDGLGGRRLLGVGWDERALPNEVADPDGEPLLRPGFGEPDPGAPGRRAMDDPDVQRLRRHLCANNGIRALEICAPDEVERAVRIYRRDGFVVVRDLLDAETLANLRAACSRLLAEILARPGLHGRRYLGETGRLPHRYCYGTSSASRQMMHEAAWTALIDMPTLTPIVSRIFGADDYLVWGGGGDLCLPGAIEYQHLHTDGVDSQQRGATAERRLACARRQPLDIDADKPFDALDFRQQRLVMDRTPPGVTVNFPMADLTWENGPIRQIPGTHTATQPPPTPAEEPEWMRLSTLVGVPAGAGILRDTRAWHGATPNLSRQVRALPSIEYSAPWSDARHFATSMPFELWQSLSPHGRRICRAIKAPPGVWPYGAGVMHPLTSGRRAAFEAGAAGNGEVRTVYTDPRSAGTAVRLFNRAAPPS